MITEPHVLEPPALLGISGRGFSPRERPCETHSLRVTWMEVPPHSHGAEELRRLRFPGAQALDPVRSFGISIPPRGWDWEARKRYSPCLVLAGRKRNLTRPHRIPPPSSLAPFPLWILWYLTGHQLANMLLPE